MFFTNEVTENSRVALDQWNYLQSERLYAHNMNVFANKEGVRSGAMLEPGRRLRLNEGLIPEDVFREFDNVSVTRMRSDEGDNYLNPLIQSARSVSIGKQVIDYRKASDAGFVNVSMSGQIGTVFDQVDYTYDGTVVPIYTTGFMRNYREMAAMKSEDFDALIDDQRECVSALRQKVAQDFLDGHTDQNGNLIVVDGRSYGGLRNDPRVVAVDLGPGDINFDFTDQSQSGESIKNAFLQIRDRMWIDNNAEMDLRYNVSREILSNFERRYDTNYDSRTIQEELESLTGVGGFQSTSKLSGNEMFAMPTDTNKLRMNTAMAINTVQLPRQTFNDDYKFMVSFAGGFDVRTDFQDRSATMYASELT